MPATTVSRVSESGNQRCSVHQDKWRAWIRRRSALHGLGASLRYRGSGPFAASRWRPLAGPGNGMSEAGGRPVLSPSRRDPGVHPASGPCRPHGSPHLAPVTPGKSSVYTPAYTPMSEAVAQFPEKLAPLFRPARYKVLYGGRGAGKSHGVATYLLSQAAATPLRVLCCREV